VVKKDKNLPKKCCPIFSSKINLKNAAEIVFDLRYEFHENRIYFEFSEKAFFCKFLSFLTTFGLKIKNFG
jgi:hypothetical protein